LIDPYGGFSVQNTILKYPLSVGYSDVTIYNNLVGEKENFFTAYYALIICAVIRSVIVLHLCAGLLYSAPFESLNPKAKPITIKAPY
jgi:hypothetical protein